MSGRYNIIGTLASGGMGTVYLARTTGSAGFSRFVAIKRLHPHYASEPQLVAMLVDEARLAVQIRHVNVIKTLDLVAAEGAFGLVLEYVEGAALGTLLEQAKARGEEIPRPIAITILRGMLRGLDAAHEARGMDGEPLDLVHRDVSPQNVLVGVDGVPRLIDFGIAKAMGRLAASTQTGEVRGKFSYMSPEQLLERPVTRQTDIYSAGVMMWQLLTGKLPFESDDSRVVMAKVMTSAVPAPSTARADIEPELDAIVLQATAREVAERYATAQEVIDALAGEPAASDEEVGAWVRRIGSAQLVKQQELRLDVPSDASRSIEELLAEAAAAPVAGSMPPPSAGGEDDETVTSPLAPEQRRKRTWVLVPIAAAIGVVGVIGGLHAAPGPVAEVATAPPLLSAPAPSVVATSAPLPSATSIERPPVVTRRPSHRRPPKPPTLGTTSAAPAPILPAHDPDTDHR